MKFELRRLAKGSLVYGLGSIVQRFIGVLLLPFFTREFSTEDYGVISLITLVSAGMTGVFNLGTSNSMGILYFKEEDLSKRPTIIWSNAILLAGVASVWIIVLSLFSPMISNLVFESPSHANLFRAAFVTLGITTVAEPFLAQLKMAEKAKQFAFISLFTSLLTTLLCILFVLYFHWGALGFFLAGFGGQVCVLLIVLVVVARKLPFSFDISLMPSLIRIGFPSIFGLFAFLIIDYGDRQILQRMVGLSDLGIYSVGYNFGMVVLLFVNAFSSAWPPFFMSFINRQEEAKEVFGNVLRYYIAGFGFLALLFFAFAKPFLSIVVAPEFVSGYTVVGMVAMAYILKGAYLILLPGLYFFHKLKIQSAIEWMTAIINIILNFVMIQYYGILGAALATVISFLFLPFFTWLFTKRFFPVRYDSKLIRNIVLGITVSCVTLFTLSIYLVGFYQVLYSVLVLIVCFFILLKTGLKKEEIGMLLDKLKKRKIA